MEELDNEKIENDKKTKEVLNINNSNHLFLLQIIIFIVNRTTSK